MSSPLNTSSLEDFLRNYQRYEFDHGDDDQKTLLLVDDEVSITRSLYRLFEEDGYRILVANDAAEGLDILAQHKVHVVLSDQRMPKMSGSEFLSIVKEIYPDTIRIILSGYADLPSATSAINDGAIFKFYTKPWDNCQLQENIRKAFQQYQLVKENVQLRLMLKQEGTWYAGFRLNLDLRV